MLPIFLVFFCFFFVLLWVLTFRVPSCDIRYSFHIKRCSVLLCLQLFVVGLMSYLCYLCSLANSGIQHVLSCVFLRLVYSMLPMSLCFSSSCVLYVASFSVFFFVLCTLCCQLLLIVSFWLPLQYSLTFISYHVLILVSI